MVVNMNTTPLLATHPLAQRRPGKRLFDLVFSALVLILGSPLYLVVCALVKLTSKGPIFFKALRMGQHGKLIHCYKFRTMCVDAQERLDALLRDNPQMRSEWQTFHKLKNDPRLTPIGAFLRKTSLDEIPQFWNVFKGDISVVGPRPIEVRKPEEAVEEIRSRYGARTDKILSAKPGITCIWQTCGRNALTFDERAVLEERYIDTQSFWLDMKLIGKTIFVLLFPKGAY